MAFPNYTYPAYGAYNPVTPFAANPAWGVSMRGLWGDYVD